MSGPVVGVDLGGTNIKAGVVSPEGEILSRGRVPTDAEGGPEAVIDRIADIARRCMDESDAPAADFAGVGIGSPGTIDLDGGIVLFSPNLPGWDHVPLRDRVAEKLGMPCVLENDANAAALAEQWVGAGRRAESLVMLTLGTGIGGGIVLEGRVWHGVGGVAGEIGHMSIDPEGPQCACGNRGCIEAYASAVSMVRRMREALESGARSSLGQFDGEFTSRDIHEAALAGDRAARENIEMTGRYLGVAIANLIHILNPAVIVLGGGVTAAGDMLMGPLREEVRQRAIEDCRRGVEVRIAELGEEAGFIGAARRFMNA